MLDCKLVSGQEFVDPINFVIGNAAQHVCQPSLRIDGVELGGFDQGIGDGCRLTAASRF
jgi:hypothetical protein